MVNGVPPTGDYSFAKYNKVRQIFFSCICDHTGISSGLVFFSINGG